MAAIHVGSGRDVPRRGLIEVRLRELPQLFHTMDPAPFIEKGLDPDAEKYIVEIAREFPKDTPLTLVVHLDQPVGSPDEFEALRSAVQAHFARRAQAARRRLSQLFQTGRISLAIGLPFLIASLVAGEMFASQLDQGPLTTVLRESLVIGGWVAMWRPLGDLPV